MHESELLQNLKANPFVLAPMAGITDKPFRSFMREMGCGIVVSELVSATGIKFASSKTLKLMEFDPIQSPVGIQLFGENLEHLTEAAQKVEQMGADFVDLNFGCPVPKVVNKGAGSACLKDPVRLGDTIRAAKSKVKIPITIKIRTGWDANTRNSHEIAAIAHNEGAAWVAIHGRTRAAAYTGLADWDYIREVKAKSPLPILGNGDLTSAELAVSRMKDSGCDGVMIGRGCLKTPRIFSEASKGGARESVNLSLILERLHEHLMAFYEERMVLLQMRKFAAWYSAGFPNAAQLRKDLFQLQQRAEIMSRIDEFFSPLQEINPEDTSREAFLMGGHG